LFKEDNATETFTNQGFQTRLQKSEITAYPNST
jgi:hypothetical protein